MMASATPDPIPARGSEIAGAARGGTITFLGATLSAGLGFVLSVLLARLLGTAAAGVVFQVIAAYTIALGLTRLGMDTTAVWLMPRLRLAQPGRVRPAALVLLGSPFLAALLVSMGWLVVGDAFGGDATDLHAALDVASWSLPAAAVMTVALAMTRAFGGVLVFNAVDNLGVPVLRVVGVVVAVGLGGGTSAAVLGWSLPWVVGFVIALASLLLRLRDPRWTTAGGRRPDRSLLRRIARYSAPRTVSAALEQSIVWIDVILVGLLVGAAAAGVYGAAARFVAAGVVVSTALRIVVAPRFSALLAQERSAEVQQLYRVTAGWILLFGAPVYLTLAVYAPTVLDLLGPGFDEGTTSMVVLCLGSIIMLAAGNVQSLLLMSGRSGLGAVNKGIVLTVNVVANLVLIPLLGILGAAVAWVASMLLDTLLAAWQVRASTGISMSLSSIVHVGLAVVLCVAGPMVCVVVVLGQGIGSLVAGVALATVVLGSWCLRTRTPLHLTELRSLRRPR